MFCDRMDVEKPQRVPLSVFRHCETFFLNFFISKGFPLQFLWCFTTDWVFKNPKGSPLSVFRLWDFYSKICFNSKGFPLSARQGLALAGPGAPLGPFFWVCIFFEKFSISEYCKENTWHLKDFLLFLSLGYMAPSWAGPVLFISQWTMSKCFASLCSISRFSGNIRIFTQLYIFTSLQCNPKHTGYFHPIWTRSTNLFIPRAFVKNSRDCLNKSNEMTFIGFSQIFNYLFNLSNAGLQR